MVVADSPFNMWCGITLHSAEQLQEIVLEHGVWPQPNQELGASDHGRLADVLFGNLLLHLSDGYFRHFVETLLHHVDLV